ncbi:hypothetical protein A2U01_0020337 [Trifolium medium]|uniref:Uncharacterized protein n=1 Tax=Trifolium medium TaxID=97028 RepID=A0A392NJQ9_9FABA|nr:hypothetical protein [Trifolium medium]
MDNWQEQHNALKGEVARLTGKLDKALELLANMSQPAQPVVVETTDPATLTSQGGSSAQNTVWPLYGLSVGYTPPGYIPTEVQQASQNTQVSQNRVGAPNTQTRVPLVQQGFVSQQENLDDPRNAYQGPELLDDVLKVNSTVPQLEEAHQKFKAIEDRLKMME